MQEIIKSQKHNSRTVQLLVLKEFVNKFTMHSMNNMMDVQISLRCNNKDTIHQYTTLYIVITNTYMFRLYEAGIIRLHVPAM
jgi:hypothetical protein